MARKGKLTRTDRTAIERALRARELLDGARYRRPSDWYEAHEHGQAQFHRSTRPIRCMFPGNGWGKTTAIAIESDAWIQRSQRWRETPAGRVTVIWFCPEFRQFNLIRPQIEDDCLTRGYSYKSSENCYQWPNGGRLFLASADRDWKFLQGINPHLIVFDEQPPLALWREMQMRRRGRVKTEFCIAATATQGITWMADIFESWLDHHLEAGLTEDQALEQQLHPEIWCWSKGGIRDNPAATDDDVRWYETRTWSSEKEKKVRLHGGFENWAGDPVFDEAAVEWMRESAAMLDEETGESRIGWLDPLYKGDPRLEGRIVRSV